MSFQLVIAEKPSVARSIAAVIGADEKQNGYWQGGGYLVSWCIGHLVSFAEAGQYDEKYCKWKYEDLPILPQPWQFIVPDEKKQQFEIVRSLLNRPDVDSVTAATDAGREGELIFRFVYQMAGCTKPVKRLWISSMEDAAIREGFANLRPDSDYDALYQSALCRAKADWLVGINATRLFSVLYHKTLTVGRVQTPTLKMLVDRDAKILRFQKEKYYTVGIQSGSLKADSGRIASMDEANTLKSTCAGTSAICTSIKRERKAEQPPKLYDLTTLQREANRLFGFTAKQTLDYAQQLYEKKLLTYPRTDSQYLTEDMGRTAQHLVSDLLGLLPLAQGLDLTPEVGRILNSKKVSDHHAIIPTAEFVKQGFAGLAESECKLMNLVCSKLLCAVAAPHEYETVTAVFSCAGNEFTAKGKTVLVPGWKEIDQRFHSTLKTDGDEETETLNTLPELAEGQSFSAVADISEHFTSPPKAYTEDTLLSAMERAGAEDIPEEAERKGLGTPATRAGIIEKLVAAGFVERKKAKKNVSLIPTQTGAALSAVLPEQLASAELTSEWEQKLSQVERGELAPEAFMSGIEGMVRELCAGYAPKLASPQFPTQGEVIGKCPRCGCNVVTGKKGYFCESSVCRFALWTDNKFLAAKRIRLSKSQAAQLLRDGRTHINEVYSAKRDTYYPADLILKDDGERVIYWLDFGRKEKAVATYANRDIIIS